jgi:hypothetical protein
MAVAARKALSESAPVRVPPPVPRIADETDMGGPPAVHDQQNALEAAFAAPPELRRLRAWSLCLLILASLGLWTAIIAGAVYVGRMVNP